MKRSSRTPPSSAHSSAYCAPPTAIFVTSLEYTRCRNVSASGPEISTSPMCETSKIPARGAHGEVLGADAVGVLDRHLPARERDELRARVAMGVETARCA